MSLWEYKVITSGRGGFATPALLEKFLNDLGREEWEIVQFQPQPDNFLAFTGLARRPTQRDWTLEDAAAAAAKAEADKLRAEFEAKFKAATNNTPGEERPASFLEEKVAPDDGFRKLIDTSRDSDTDVDDKDEDEDDWDKLSAAQEEELPTFFDAIKPHMRRNQRGPGMSVGVDYLAKKWDQSEEDLKGALAECGFAIPEDEDAKPEYLEFEGDLYWININRRGELWINTKEKPRPVFRAVKAQKVAIEEPEPKGGEKQKRHERQDRHERPEREQKADESAPKPENGEAAAASAGDTQPATPAAESGPSEPLPEGTALLDKIRPMMRRNRRGPGGSGSVSFLSRALKCREPELVEAFKRLGLVVPASANDKATNVEIGDGIWWVNLDSRGNVWINGREKRAGEKVEATAPATGGETPAGADAGASSESASAASDTIKLEVATAVPFSAVPDNGGTSAVPQPETVPAASVEAHAPAAMGAAAAGALQAVRPLLKETKTGGFAGKLERVAEELGQPAEALTTQLVGAGLVVPEKPREKPVFVEHSGEIFWFNRNAKGELWVNAKASKFGDKAEGEGESAEGEKKPRRPRGRGKKAE